MRELSSSAAGGGWIRRLNRERCQWYNLLRSRRFIRGRLELRRKRLQVTHSGMATLSDDSLRLLEQLRSHAVGIEQLLQEHSEASLAHRHVVRTFGTIGAVGTGANHEVPASPRILRVQRGGMSARMSRSRDLENTGRHVLRDLVRDVATRGLARTSHSVHFVLK